MATDDDAYFDRRLSQREQRFYSAYFIAAHRACIKRVRWVDGGDLEIASVHPIGHGVMTWSNEPESRRTTSGNAPSRLASRRGRYGPNAIDP